MRHPQAKATVTVDGASAVEQDGEIIVTVTVSNNTGISRYAATLWWNDETFDLADPAFTVGSVNTADIDFQSSAEGIASAQSAPMMGDGLLFYIHLIPKTGGTRF